MKIKASVAALAVLLLAAGSALAGGLAASMDEAVQLAQESGQPVLLDIGTSW